MHAQDAKTLLAATWKEIDELKKLQPNNPEIQQLVCHFTLIEEANKLITEQRIEYLISSLSLLDAGSR